ncbi:MarC family NAAT transporter [Brumimicrobium sp.]|uniref:MarC family NAAT transporter n=1 Tax=Brumimicrobium sp. TaxID=2029867 RepID=UPI003A928F36
MELFFYAFAAIISIANPLGTLPIFVGLTSDYSKKERRKTALLTSFNVLVIFLMSFYLGSYLLDFFGISLNSLRIAGGLIIVSSGFALLTGRFNKHKGMDKERVKSDIASRESISLTPLAIPMLAGPGSISLLIGLHQEYTLWNAHYLIIIAILLVCLVIWGMLSASSVIVKYLGASGINAVSRIIGFIVIAIGIEYISTAVVNVVLSIIASV